MKMLIYDAAAFLGIGGFSYGCYQINPALAWLVGGAALVYFGLSGALIAKQGKRK